jgi:hypothetical protein
MRRAELTAHRVRAAVLKRVNETRTRLQISQISVELADT